MIRVRGDPPFVSVIVPAFNSSRYLREAIGSIARQTYGQLEVIVVDDGSKDDTVVLARAALLSMDLDGVVLQRPETHRKGAGGSRNFGVSKARGDVVAFLDSDDVWHPEHLARAVAVFLRHQSEVGVYCASATKFSDDGTEAGPLPESGFKTLGVQDALPLLLEDMFMPTTTLCVTIDVFRCTTGFHEEVECFEDWWLVLQLAQHTKFYFDDAVGCSVRLRGGSLSRAGADGRLIMSSAMYRDQLLVYDRASESGVFNDNDLKVMRRSRVNWYVQQLSDLIAAGRLGDAGRIVSAISSSGSIADGLVPAIAVETVASVARRASKRLSSSLFGRRS